MDNSPFNKLPAELVNRIAELALHQCTSIDIWSPQKSATKLHDFELTVGEDKMSIKQPTAFAQACKQLHHDYMLVFYSANSFVVHTSHNEVASCIKAFLNAIGPKNASAMPGLLVTVHLGLCRHPREIRSKACEPRNFAESVAAVSRPFVDMLYPANAVDIELTLTNIMNDFQKDAKLIQMVKGCQNTEMKVVFTAAGVPDHTYEIVLNCNRMKQYLLGLAGRVAAGMTSNLDGMIEHIFRIRLMSLLQHLGVEYTE